MVVNIDLLGFAGAEYCDRDGVKGVFIPEEPNFDFRRGVNVGKKSSPSRAVVSSKLKKVSGKTYGWCGGNRIPRKYYDAYMANPNFVNRKRLCVFVYGKDGRTGNGTNNVSTIEDFERMLDE